MARSQPGLGAQNGEAAAVRRAGHPRHTPCPQCVVRPQPTQRARHSQRLCGSLCRTCNDCLALLRVAWPPLTARCRACVCVGCVCVPPGGGPGRWCSWCTASQHRSASAHGQRCICCCCCQQALNHAPVTRRDSLCCSQHVARVAHHCHHRCRRCSSSGPGSTQQSPRWLAQPSAASRPASATAWRARCGGALARRRPTHTPRHAVWGGRAVYCPPPPAQTQRGAAPSLMPACVPRPTCAPALRSAC
jgi:hypothetical protein